MASIPTIKSITAADVGNPVRDKLFEVIHGEWVKRPMAGELHGAIEANVVLLFGGFVKANKLGRIYTGDTTFVLEGTPENIETMRLPDVAFVSAGRVKDIDREGFYYLAPDLAIEIVSPSEKTTETQSKINDFLRTGTRQVWVLYPDTRQISVHLADGSSRIFSSSDSISGGDVLPGFSISVNKIFDV